MPSSRLTIADLKNPRHRQSIIELLDMYSRDPLGNASPLSSEVSGRLIDGLEKQPGTLVLLALEGDEAVGICVCFASFSTFLARPILNIHDIAVRPEHRNRGIGRRLLHAVQAQARQRGCCRITLEVRDDNVAAQHLYQDFGFRASAPPMHFWHKPLNPTTD